MTQTMERPERYDPEDIEHLMLERPFDELLAEEKAFVLRHLQDADEYGRMRALLLHMQEESGQQPVLDADPMVRHQVLQAFREQRQPKWRIWLNSIGALLMPARPVQYLKPALALGSLALLISVSLLLWNTMYRPEPKILVQVDKVPGTPTIQSAEPSPTSTPEALAEEVDGLKEDRSPSMALEKKEEREVAAPPAVLEELEVDYPISAKQDESVLVGLAEAARAEVMGTEHDQSAYDGRLAPAKASSMGNAMAMDAAPAANDHAEAALLDLLRAAW